MFSRDAKDLASAVAVQAEMYVILRCVSSGGLLAFSELVRVTWGVHHDGIW